MGRRSCRHEVGYLLFKITVEWKIHDPGFVGRPMPIENIVTSGIASSEKIPFNGLPEGIDAVDQVVADGIRRSHELAQRDKSLRHVGSFYQIGTVIVGAKGNN